MDLLRVQDTLKNASDQQLMHMMRAPDSTAPSYLVLSEIRRRSDMRKRQVPDEGSRRTVAEDLTAPESQGIRDMQMPEQASPDMDDQAGIEAMREGGVVRMQAGGPTGSSFAMADEFDPLTDLPMPPPRTPAQGSMAGGDAGDALANSAGFTFADILRRNQSLIPDGIASLRERAREERVDPEARRNQAVNMALIEAGLRMAGSRNPSFMGAIGEGALPAVQAYGQQLGQIRTDQRNARRDEAEMARQELNRQISIGQISQSEYNTRLQQLGLDRRFDQEMVQRQAALASQERSAGANRALQERLAGAETFGQPQVGIMDGQPVMVQYGNRGNVRRVQGVQPLMPNAAEPRQTTRQEQVAMLIENGVAPEMARGIASGQYDLSRNFADGTQTIIDRASGRILFGPGAGGFIGQPILRPPSGASPGAGEQPGSASANTIMPPEANFRGAFGAPGFISESANAVVDLFGGTSLPAPRVAQATQALNGLRVRTLEGLQAAFGGRPTNFQLELIDGLVPNPGLIRLGPERAFERVQQTRAMVQRSVDQLQEISDSQNTGRFSGTRISQANENIIPLRGLLADYDTLLSLMGSARGTDSAPRGTNPMRRRQDAQPDPGGGTGGRFRYNPETDNVEPVR